LSFHEEEKEIIKKVVNNRQKTIDTLKKMGEIVVVAKAEIIYAYLKDFYPNQTVEEVMDQIKDNPENYNYYKIGNIKITEIRQV